MRGVGITQWERFAVDLGTRSGIWLVEPGEDLDEGRLAGAVLADESVNLPGADLEVDFDQRARTREGLAEPVDREDAFRPDALGVRIRKLDVGSA
jgi:hypothetical protein